MLMKKEQLAIDIVGLAGACLYALDCIEAELVNIKKALLILIFQTRLESASNKRVSRDRSLFNKISIYI